MQITQTQSQGAGVGGHQRNSRRSPHRAGLSLPFHPLRCGRAAPKATAGVSPQLVPGGWPRCHVSVRR